jgi:hypothetical protein
VQGRTLPVGVSESDYRTRTRTVRCRCFSDCRASALFFSFVRCSSRAKLAWRIIVRYACCWVKNELLFAPDPASQLGLRAPRTIVRLRNQPSREAGDVGLRTSQLFGVLPRFKSAHAVRSLHARLRKRTIVRFLPSLTPGRTKKTHASAWVFSVDILFYPCFCQYFSESKQRT